MPAASSAAERLIDEYGSIGALLAECRRRRHRADAADTQTDRELLWFSDAMTCVLRDELLDQPVLDGGGRVADYLRARMAHCKVEQFRILYLDVANRLIRDEVAATGTVDASTLYPRSVIARALDLGAAALVVAHNHPSGDPAPSPADLACTRSLAFLCRAMGIHLHDHVIVGRCGITSLRAEGLLSA